MFTTHSQAQSALARVNLVRDTKTQRLTDQFGCIISCLDPYLDTNPRLTAQCELLIDRLPRCPLIR